MEELPPPFSDRYVRCVPGGAGDAGELSNNELQASPKWGNGLLTMLGKGAGWGRGGAFDWREPGHAAPGVRRKVRDRTDRSASDARRSAAARHAALGGPTQG